MKTSDSEEAIYKLIEGGKKEEDFKPKRPIANDLLTREKRREREYFENKGKNNGRARKGGVKKKWSRKYKKSINCKKPKGFSQKQYCKYGKRKIKRTIKKKN